MSQNISGDPTGSVPSLRDPRKQNPMHRQTMVDRRDDNDRKYLQRTEKETALHN